MLIKCPRCQFVQPQDRYCANCGVDMERYKQKPRSLFQRLSQSLVLQIFLVFATAAFVSWMLYQKKQKEIDDRVEYLRTGVQVTKSLASTTVASENIEEVTPQNLDSPPQATASFSDSSNSTALETSKETNDNSSFNKNNNALAVSSDKNSPSDNSKLDKASLTKEDPTALYLQLLFVEIPQSVLMQVFDESRSSGQFNSLGDHVAGLISAQAKNEIFKLNGVRILSQEIKKIPATKSVLFYYGQRPQDVEDPLGLEVQVDVIGTSQPGYSQLNIEVRRSWRERRTYPAVVELSAGSHFFMTELIPRTLPTDAADDLLNLSPFQILKTGAFRNRNTEALMLMELIKK